VIDDVASNISQVLPKPKAPENVRIIFAGAERAEATLARAEGKGLTLVHFSAQLKHILWDTFGAWFCHSQLDRRKRGGDQKGLGQVKL
jgi:hypothetical protein